MLSGAFGNLAATQAQSRRQPPATNQKKNKRPDGTETDKNETPNDVVGKPQEAETVTVSTSLVNIAATVYHKKTGQIMAGLKKENFAIFEDGVQKDITNFSTPEAPLTVAMVVEYSKLTANLGGDGSEEGRSSRSSCIRPMITSRSSLSTCARRRSRISPMTRAGFRRR